MPFPAEKKTASNGISLIGSIIEPFRVPRRATLIQQLWRAPNEYGRRQSLIRCDGAADQSPDGKRDVTEDDGP